MPLSGRTKYNIQVFLVALYAHYLSGVATDLEASTPFPRNSRGADIDGSTVHSRADRDSRSPRTRFPPFHSSQRIQRRVLRMKVPHSEVRPILKRTDQGLGLTNTQNAQYSGRGTKSTRE
ncbi:hypothetical protein BJX65DRAFT_291452 [Aspergillus insuetus]